MTRQLVIPDTLTDPAEEWPRYLEFGVVVFDCWKQRVKTSRAFDRFQDTRNNKNPKTASGGLFRIYLGDGVFATGAAVWLRRARLWDEEGTIWVYDPMPIIAAAQAANLELSTEVLEIEDPQTEE